MKRKLITNDLFTYSTRLGVGLIAGYILSLVPQPFLHCLLYRDIPAVLEVFVYFALVLGLALLAYYLPKPFRFSRKKTRKFIFMGISIASFALGLWTFLHYPSTLASTKYLWLNQWIVGGVSIGSLEFFVATILWDGFMGSFFAVLEHLLT
jgi:hypothetical protein